MKRLSPLLFTVQSVEGKGPPPAGQWGWSLWRSPQVMVIIHLWRSSSSGFVPKLVGREEGSGEGEGEV